MDHENHCWYCGTEMVSAAVNSKGKPMAHFKTRDHVIPRKVRGHGGVSPVVPCCFSCNKQKMDMTLEEYRKYVEKRCKRLGLSWKGKFWFEEQGLKMPEKPQSMDLHPFPSKYPSRGAKAKHESTGEAGSRRSLETDL